MSSRRFIVDTDTAVDDAIALLLALRSERLDVEGVTVVAGNAPFEREVENAKHVLELVGAADRVPVCEGARSPLVKTHEHAEEVHGEGGLGGELFPDTGVPSAEEGAVEFLLRTARGAPGEVSLLCLGPLTNVAMALARDPDLGDLLEEVWVMGGAVNRLGNVTPAAEYNFWADPDAAKRVVRDLDVFLVDWGLSVEEGFIDAETFARVESLDTGYAEFFRTITGHVRSFSRENRGADGAVVSDALAAALALAPELRGEVGTYHADVEERAGPTRGYSLVDEDGVLGEEGHTRIVESADGDGFADAVVATLAGDPPESAL
jgi:purine nucleosidase